MGDLAYIVAVALSSVVGFIVGFIVGAVVNSRSVAIRHGLLSANTFVGGLVLLIGILGSVLIGQQSSRLSAVADCQTRGFAAFSDALNARNTAQEGQIQGLREQAQQQLRQNQAQLALLSTPPGNPELGSQAIETYRRAVAAHNVALQQLIDAQEQVSQSRRDNPLYLPKCGG